MYGLIHTLMDDDKKMFIMNRMSMELRLHHLSIADFIQLQEARVGNSSGISQTIYAFLFGFSILSIGFGMSLSSGGGVEGLGEGASPESVAQAGFRRRSIG